MVIFPEFNNPQCNRISFYKSGEMVRIDELTEVEVPAWLVKIIENRCEDSRRQGQEEVREDMRRILRVK